MVENIEKSLLNFNLLSSNEQQKLVVKMVRGLIFMEGKRRESTREELRKLVFLNVNLNCFDAVLHHAQLRLNDLFGMEICNTAKGYIVRYLLTQLDRLLNLASGVKMRNI